jgi:hypothetical protein
MKSMKERVRIAKKDQDVKVLFKACEWIEKSSSPRRIKATAKYIYDRYVRHSITWDAVEL